VCAPRAAPSPHLCAPAQPPAPKGSPSLRLSAPRACNQALRIELPLLRAVMTREGTRAASAALTSAASASVVPAESKARLSRRYAPCPLGPRVLAAARSRRPPPRCRDGQLFTAVSARCR
jgi:hypothetical protein